MSLPQVPLVPQEVQTLQRVQLPPLSHAQIQPRRRPPLQILNGSYIIHAGHHPCLPYPTPAQTRSPQRLSGLKSLLPIPLSSSAIYVPQVPRVRPSLEAQLHHPPPLSRTQTLLQGGVLPLPRVISAPCMGPHSSPSPPYPPQVKTVSLVLAMPCDA